MEKSKIKQLLARHYKPSSVRAILNGGRKPSLDVIAEFEKEGIPISAWLDFPSWLNSQTIPTQATQPQVDEEKQNHTSEAAWND